jgi:hypothetical protein
MIVVGWNSEIMKILIMDPRKKTLCQNKFKYCSFLAITFITFRLSKQQAHFGSK